MEVRPTALYRPNLSLLTDLYQLTMAQGYWHQGIAEREACFHLTFRRCPFRGSYAIACGLADAIDLLENLAFEEDDLAWLGTLTGNDSQPLFDPGFLAWLGSQRFTCNVDAMPEGTLVFPHEPLLRVTGPLALAQLVETPLLTLLNFQTLLATKAARICRTADRPVLEFGLRRAQGIDGGLSASRAAWVGGVAGTSNVLAGRLYNIPVKGTHAHSWVMVFEDEVEAFSRYAEALPNNCVFLVDTYDTLEGVRRACTVGHRLADQGHRLVGIRLDSGDLGFLAHEARRILDEEGFTDARIVASNDLDEHRIGELKAWKAPIDQYGVGTRLVTAHDQPALGGVYKLSALRDADGRWQPRIKRSNSPLKTSWPGVQQVRRFFDRESGLLLGDLLYDEVLGVETLPEGVPADADSVDVLEPVLRQGVRVRALADLPTARARCQNSLDRLPARHQGLAGADTYPVHREAQLVAVRDALLQQGSTP